MSGSEKGRSKRGRRWPKGPSLKSRLPLLHKVQSSRGKVPVRNEVYDQLRHMILYGDVPPGAWLRQEELTKVLGVSRTPIREALHSLSQEGLVELMPNHGARVSLLSMEEFEELYALRGGIEGLGARLAVESLKSEHLERLEGMLAGLEELSTSADLPVYLREEWKFRLALYETTGRESLIEQITSLRERAERYLRLAYTVEGRVEESLRFHRRLFQSCKAREAADAERTVQEALRWTVEKAGPVIAAGLQAAEQEEE